MLYRVYATFPVLIETELTDEEEIKKRVANAIAARLPSIPTDYSGDFFVEPIVKKEEIYEREQEVVPLGSTQRCKDIIVGGEVNIPPIPDEILALDTNKIGIKEEFDDESA